MKKIGFTILILLLLPSLFIKESSSNNNIQTSNVIIENNTLKINPKNRFLTRLFKTSNNNYDINDFHLIEDYEYFTSLYSFPDNLEGSCGFVALSIVLGYLDDNLDDNILNDEFNDGFKNTNNFLHDTLLDYDYYINIPLTPISKASTARHLRDTFFDFRRDYIDESIYPSIFVGSHDGPLFNDNPDLNSIRNYIDNDIPVIIMMRKFSYFPLGSTTVYTSSWHEVVVYGYLGDMFLVHLGWKNHSPTAIINTYNIQSFIAIGDINKLLKNKL